MNKLKLAVICNNFGLDEYGIGKYSGVIVSHFPEWVEVKVFDGYCDDYSNKFAKIFNPNMIKAIIKSIHYVKSVEIDAIIIEYPFADWNPLIIPTVAILKRKLHKKNGLLFISLHEYERVSTARKRVIELLCRASDAIFVYTKSMGEQLKPYCPNYYIRNICSTVSSDTSETDIIRDPHVFAYFGMITTMKAFEEMLTGWDMFNKDSLYKLYIITATKLEKDIYNHKNIEYIYNANDETIINTMRRSAFSVLPIKPYIDNKNSTLKTSCQCGCISIGVFGKEFDTCDFVVRMKDYNPNSFAKAFDRAAGLSIGQMKKMSNEAKTFSEQYTPESIAKGIAEDIIEHKRRNGFLSCKGREDDSN